MEGGIIRKLPCEDGRDNETGKRVVDPEQPSVELLPQINGFPTTLQKKQWMIICSAESLYGYTSKQNV